jgi:hypothetical protein
MPVQVGYSSSALKGNNAVEQEVRRLMEGSAFRATSFHEYSEGYGAGEGRGRKRFSLTVYLTPEKHPDTQYLIIEADTDKELFDYINIHLRAPVTIPPAGVAIGSGEFTITHADRGDYETDD